MIHSKSLRGVQHRCVIDFQCLSRLARNSLKAGLSRGFPRGDGDIDRRQVSVGSSERILV